MERENDSSISLCAPVQPPDPVEARLVADLETLLTVDVGLSDRYRVLLRNHRKTRRERKILRAELRRLHTQEGGVLLQLKVYLAKKGRGGGWAEFLRQRKPKQLARTTADRWIKWYLDSRQLLSQVAAVAAEAPENAPRNESGAFSTVDDPQPPATNGAQSSAATDAQPGNGSDLFEDLQQVVLVLKRSQAAHLKAAADFLVGKNGSATRHEAVYLAVAAEAARFRFVLVGRCEGRNHKCQQRN
jgi:hypothetical protein